MANGEDLRRVGRAVAARRGELGMTQQDLADAAGVDLKTVYNLESGGRWPIARTRVAISGALGWPGDALAEMAAGQPAARPAPTPVKTLPASEAPLPVVVNTAREAGIDPFDPDDPWTRPVRDRVDAAKRIHGDNPTGSQIFFGEPSSSYEAGFWDAGGANEETRIIGIAIIRTWSPHGAGQQNHGRSGRAGLVPALTLARR